MYNFINPYSFVPFSDIAEKKSKEETYRGKEQQNLLTGWLDVDLYIKTPLIIPDGAHPKFWDISNEKGKELSQEQYLNLSDSDKRKVHKQYDFFKAYNPEKKDEIEREYCIPGSELRGLIRSVYETATNSCFPFLLNDKPISQRVPIYGALTNRGLLGFDDNKWVLYSTRKITEEVIVVPVYKINNRAYVDNLDRVRNYKKNKDYDIIKNIDLIENSIKSGNVRIRNTDYRINMITNQNGSNSNVITSKDLKKHQPELFLFIKADGTRVSRETGTEVDYQLKDGKKEKRWIQYNVPVDLDSVYHIAYLKKMEEVYRWNDSIQSGGNNRIDSKKSEAYKKLLSALKRDGASGVNPNKQCTEALIKALNLASNTGNNNKYVPVYYFVVGDKQGNRKAYLSGSAIGRIAQRRKWEEIMGDFVPCKDKLCPACLLFGTINGTGMKGHIRVSDAFLNGETESKVHTLDILASPRTTAFEFYLKKPVKNATYWDFDFYGVTNEDSSGSSHTEYYHLEKAMPRGRKMYWHHNPPNDVKKNNMNNTMESLEKGSFSFRLFFDQINIDQLKDLIWSINLGENKEDSKLQQKLGHAKPLGYGSIKMVVKNGNVRSFKKDGSFNLSVKGLKEIGLDVNSISPSFDCESETIKSLLKICDASVLDGFSNAKVDYPRLIEDGKIFEWFSKNRTNARYLKVLPEITDSDLVLNSEGFPGMDKYEKDTVSDSQKQPKSQTFHGKEDPKEKSKALRILCRSPREWDSNTLNSIAKKFEVKKSQIDFIQLTSSIDLLNIYAYEGFDYLIFDSYYKDKDVQKESLIARDTFKAIYKNENGNLVKL